MVEQFLNWFGTKAQQNGWRGYIWQGVTVIVQAIVLPFYWLFGREGRKERRENNESILFTFYAIGLLWLMVWGVITAPIRWFHTMYMWPYTKSFREAAKEEYENFKAQLDACKEGNNYDMAFACWLEFINNYPPYAKPCIRELQRGWDLLKTMFPDVAHSYDHGYPLALQQLGIKR